MSHISAKDVTFLGLVFVIMVPAGRFALLSDNEVIVFSEQMKTENNETRYKRYSGNLSKRDKRTEIEDNTPVERQAYNHQTLCAL